MEKNLVYRQKKLSTVDKVDYSKEGRPSKVLPDQSMSIKEIMIRFTRNVPVLGSAKQPVFNDQTEFDLEKLSRMDFAEKADFAREQRDRAQRLNDEIQAKRSERMRAYNEQRERRKEALRDPDESAGIDDLDNTMPDDTDLTNRKLGKRGGKNEK